MKRVIFSTLAIGLLVSPVAFGAVSDEDIEELREQLAVMSQRLEELAAENEELRRAQEESATAIADVQTDVAEAASAPAATDSWSDRVRLDGDFRYRYERIDAEGSDTRRRNRILDPCGWH